MRDAEVGDQCSAGACLEEDVVRLDVTMDDASTVRIGQRPRDLAQHACGVGGWQWPTRAESLAKRLALHVAHDEEDEAARFTYAMNGDDVGVRESSGRASLTNKAFARLVCEGQVRRKHLDGDVAIQLHIAREIDHAHPAPAELALERVLASQRALQIHELDGKLSHVRQG